MDGRLLVGGTRGGVGGWRMEFHQGLCCNFILGFQLLFHKEHLIVVPGWHMALAGGRCAKRLNGRGGCRALAAPRWARAAGAATGQAHCRRVVVRIATCMVVARGAWLRRLGNLWVQGGEHGMMCVHDDRQACITLNPQALDNNLTYPGHKGHLRTCSSDHGIKLGSVALEKGPHQFLV